MKWLLFLLTLISIFMFKDIVDDVVHTSKSCCLKKTHDILPEKKMVIC